MDFCNNALLGMEIQLNNRKQVSAEASVSFCLPMMGAV
jgi:hypothetical protein